MNPDPTAYVLLIGNELLGGKIVDSNGALAVAGLNAHGFRVLGMAVVPDEIPRIVYTLRTVRERLHPSVIITSGGVGPTHDDLTHAAVAEALDRDLAMHEPFLEIIRAGYGERANAHVLGMATIAAGAELLCAEGGAHFPIVKIDTVHVLPGEPRLFARLLKKLLPTLPGAAPQAGLRVRTTVDEWAIAERLEALQDAFPDVAVGSYPQRSDDGTAAPEASWWTLVTLDGRDRQRVMTAGLHLRRLLDANEVAGIEAVGGLLPLSPAEEKGLA